MSQLNNNKLECCTAKIKQLTRRESSLVLKIRDFTNFANRGERNRRRVNQKVKKFKRKLGNVRLKLKVKKLEAFRSCVTKKLEEIDMAANERPSGYFGALNFKRLASFFLGKIEAHPQLFVLIKDVIDALRVAQVKIENLESALNDASNDTAMANSSLDQSLDGSQVAAPSLQTISHELDSINEASSDLHGKVEKKKKKKGGKKNENSFISDNIDPLCDSNNDPFITVMRKKRKRKKSEVGASDDASFRTETPSSDSQLILNISTKDAGSQEDPQIKRALSENPGTLSSAADSCDSSKKRKKSHTTSISDQMEMLPSNANENASAFSGRFSDDECRKLRFQKAEFEKTTLQKVEGADSSLDNFPPWSDPTNAVDSKENLPKKHHLDAAGKEEHVSNSTPQRFQTGSDESNLSTKPSPSLRVIPSAFLLENPDSYEVPPNACESCEKCPWGSGPPPANVAQNCSSSCDKELATPEPLMSVHPWKVYFEFDGSVEANRQIEMWDIFNAVLEVVNHSQFDITGIRRYRYTLSGYANFSDFQSAKKVAALGFKLNGKAPKRVKGVKIPPPRRASNDLPQWRSRDGNSGNRHNAQRSGYFDRNNLHSNSRNSYRNSSKSIISKNSRPNRGRNFFHNTQM